MKKVLVIEDDKRIAELLEIHLKDLGCAMDYAWDGESGLEMAETEPYDLIILDLSLPKLDGLEICRRVRSMDNYTPILMLTARVEEVDRVVGLELGADDYLPKPFSVRELLARVKAIFRRVDVLKAEQGKNSCSIRHAGLSIDAEKRKVLLGGKKVELTAKEFDLLYLLAKNPGRAYTRQNLLDIVWGYQFDGYDHTVNSHINRLRSKVELDPSRPRYILTVWGVGYRFAEVEELEDRNA